MKQADDHNNLTPNEEFGTQIKGAEEMTDVQLDNDHLDKVVGGATKFIALTSINHCKNPRGKCKKSTRTDQQHAWTIYKKDYICLYCEQWAHAEEL